MATSVTNGKGGIIDVTSTAQQIDIVAAPTTGVHNKDAMTLKVWNTGGSTIYVVVNTQLDQYVEASAVPIPPDSDFWFVAQPIKRFVIATASGDTSTASYGAY